MSSLLLIGDYFRAVDECLSLFENKFGRRDLIRAWREGVIPQAGTLSEYVKYHMHGAGCAVEFPGFDVDFDFANWEEVGFDSWRLWQYAKQFQERYSDFQKQEEVKAAIKYDESEGMIIPFEDNNKLFKLTLKGSSALSELQRH